MALGFFGLALFLFLSFDFDQGSPSPASASAASSSSSQNVEITYGTVLKLMHEKTKFRLHSHDVPYGSGSGQQSVTGFPNVDDSNSYWTILELRMGDSLEAQISIVEHIQEEFGHNIQEMKGQLVMLTKLIEGHTGATSENTCGSLSFPLQTTLPSFIHQQHPGHGSQIPIRDNVPPNVHQRHPSHELQIPIRGNVSLRVHHPNWQPHAPTPAIIPTFGKVSQPVDLASSSENNLEKPRRNRDKKRWDPIPVTYTELLPRLLERQLVALSHVIPLQPPFPKSYNPNVHCDYHMGIPGHSTEDCICLKNQVQTLIEVGKINFENSSQPSKSSVNFFGAGTEEKIGSTSEKTEEEKKASELQKENEKLRRLVQDMAYMMTEQKESIATLRRGM